MLKTVAKTTKQKNSEIQLKIVKNCGGKMGGLSWGWVGEGSMGGGGVCGVGGCLLRGLGTDEVMTEGMRGLKKFTQRGQYCCGHCE